jgi:acetyl-CoA decarbonylase/synthase complex subunit alpha
MEKEVIKPGRYVVVGMENVEIKIGKVVEQEEAWEPMGPTPKPGILTLRNWDHFLMSRYKPFYAPHQDFCNLCTQGPCDLTGNKEGACGIDLMTQKSRIVLAAVCLGHAAHASHARHVYHSLVHKFGKDVPIDLGVNVNVEAPVTRLVTGIKPKTIGDFDEVLSYVEEQFESLVSSLHTGQEGSYIDFESKSLHCGMLDQLAMEVADILQISALNFPKADPNAPLIEYGFGSIDSTKPVIIGIGHNVMPSTGILDYLDINNLWDKIEFAACCCTAHDNTRYNKKAKYAGTLAQQLRVIRSGLADVIVTDEQCVRTDVLKECKCKGIPVIATNEKICYGLPDRTKDRPEDIVKDMLAGAPGALITDPDVIGTVAVNIAIGIAKVRKSKNQLMSDEMFKKWVAECTQCNACTFVCHHGLRPGMAMEAAEKGDNSLLINLLQTTCMTCGKCEWECPRNIPIVDVMIKAGIDVLRNEKGKVRSGRGAIDDAEIRTVGAPIVLGTIPGIIAPIGCANYPDDAKAVYDVCEEFLKRSYIVMVSGCHAIDIGKYKNEEGLTLYERFPGVFNAGGLVNVGSCVSNAHIAGAAIKVANIFAKLPLRGNYEQIADYILNRVGAVGLSWGAMSQKAASIATGFNRLGIPAVIGPQGAKLRRSFMGRKDKPEDWMLYDIRDSSSIQVEPGPEHLLYIAETKEEAIVKMARLVIRPNDTDKGRAIKLSHYLDLSEKYYGKLPDDWHLFVRTATDLPVSRRKELLRVLEEKYGWKIDHERMKILEGPMRKFDSGFNPTNLVRLLKEVKPPYSTQPESG